MADDDSSRRDSYLPAIRGFSRVMLLGLVFPVLHGVQHDGRLHKELPFFVLHFTWNGIRIRRYDGDSFIFFIFFLLSRYPKIVSAEFQTTTPSSAPYHRFWRGHVCLRADRWIKLPSAFPVGRAATMMAGEQLRAFTASDAVL